MSLKSDQLELGFSIMSVCGRIKKVIYKVYNIDNLVLVI